MKNIELKKSVDFGASSSERTIEAMLPYPGSSRLSMVLPKDGRVEDALVKRKDIVPLKKKA